MHTCSTIINTELRGHDERHLSDLRGMTYPSYIIANCSIDSTDVDSVLPRLASAATRLTSREGVPCHIETGCISGGESDSQSSLIYASTLRAWTRSVVDVIISRPRPIFLACGKEPQTFWSGRSNMAAGQSSCLVDRDGKDSSCLCLESSR